MSVRGPFAEKLRQLPKSERSSALADWVAAEFKLTLMMTDEEDLPLEQSYFEVGLTSLGLMEIKERLEAQLGAGISAETLFNHPTVRQLLDHLATDILADMMSKPEQPAGPVGEEPGDTAAAPAPLAGGGGGGGGGGAMTAQGILDELIERAYAAGYADRESRA
jgi:acyl carrier protein